MLSLRLVPRIHWAILFIHSYMWIYKSFTEIMLKQCWGGLKYCMCVLKCPKKKTPVFHWRSVPYKCMWINKSKTCSKYYDKFLVGKVINTLLTNTLAVEIEYLIALHFHLVWAFYYLFEDLWGWILSSSLSVLQCCFSGFTCLLPLAQRNA